MRTLLLFVATVAMIGCADTQPQISATPGAQAECLVCKMNVDLACIDVAVQPTTPTYMYNDTTYYFCSETCKSDFAKNPAKYVK